jgi:hypothetical protein
MVVLSLVQVLEGQRYSSDGFLCLGDFFHHDLKDCTCVADFLASSSLVGRMVHHYH